MTEKERKAFIEIARLLNDVQDYQMPICTSSPAIILRENLNGWIAQLVTKIHTELTEAK